MKQDYDSMLELMFKTEFLTVITKKFKEKTGHELPLRFVQTWVFTSNISDKNSRELISLYPGPISEWKKTAGAAADWEQSNSSRESATSPLWSPPARCSWSPSALDFLQIPVRQLITFCSEIFWPNCILPQDQWKWAQCGRPKTTTIGRWRGPKWASKAGHCLRPLPPLPPDLNNTAHWGMPLHPPANPPHPTNPSCDHPWWEVHQNQVSIYRKQKKNWC